MRISDWSSDVCSSDLLWQLSDITITEGDGSPRRFDAVREWRIDLDPDSLGHLSTHTRHLSFDQTRRFAGGAGQGTWAPYLYRTRLYEKLSSEEHTRELQSLMRTSYAVICLKQKNTTNSN